LFFHKITQNTTINIYNNFSIIYINIVIYISLLLLFTCLLFLFDIKKLKTLNNLKIFNKHYFLSISAVLLFLSISGIPPLAGFVGKFLLLNYIYFLQKYFILLMFSCLNFFSIYFYIQNLRFLISDTFLNFFLISGFYVFFNKHLVNIIVFLNFLNFFLILYMEDFMFICICIFTHRFV